MCSTVSPHVVIAGKVPCAVLPTAEEWKTCKENQNRKAAYYDPGPPTAQHGRSPTNPSSLPSL